MRPRSNALRRRRKPSFATRLKIAWVFILTIVAAAGYAGYLLVTLPQLRVAAVDISIDGLAVTRAQVVRAAAINHNANIWLLDTAQIARRIEAIPYVAHADVMRMPPAQLALHVTEREPAACVHSGARVVTVDRALRILQNGCARTSAVAIELHTGMLGAPGSFENSPSVATLLNDSRTLAEARVSVRAIHEDHFGGIVAVAPDGITFLFGSDTNLDEKAKLVAPVLAAAARAHAIRTIDLRAPATPTVQFR